MAPAKHHHAHHRHDHGVHKNDRKYHEEKHKRAAEAQQAALLAAAAKGDVEGVMQYIMNERNAQNHLLLHACFRAAQESEIPSFKGSDLGRFPLVSADFWTGDHLSERPRRVDAFRNTRARAAETANEQGWFPLHILAHTTARPTTTMVRALTVLYPAAARAPIVSGWLPLQLLCQHARNKGDNSHHGVRGAALLSALRAAYPGAATECLPQARKNGLGEKTAESLLPFDLPHREACVAALRENARHGQARDHDRFEAERLRASSSSRRGARRTRATRRASSTCSSTRTATTAASRTCSTTGATRSSRCLDRCGETLDDASFDYLPRVAGRPFRGTSMLPIHTLMNGCEAATPTWPAASATSGDLPIHLFCQTCADLKDVVEQEIASGNYGRARRRPPPKKKTKVENVRAAFRRASVAVGLAGGGDDDDEPEAPEEEAYAWNADQAVACVKLLVKAYPESWRLAGKGKVTSWTSRPELHEAMLKAADGRAGDGSESSDDDLDNKFNLAKFEDGLHDVKTHKHQRHKVDLETADLGDVVDDGKTDEGLCSRLLRRYDGANARDAGEHGGFLLHRLLRRKPDVGADVLRAVLTWSSKAARTADGEGWHPLHLLARRATTDRSVTGASARRVLNTFRECAVLRGGGDGRLQNPLAALCAHLTHKSAHVKTPLSYENHWTKETYDEHALGRMAPAARARRAAFAAEAAGDAADEARTAPRG
ncbi:hypothetical protein JL720_10678 [Aureococcus anophagefferens]|nr:hypothetical protein JL720_10678 [Aureococcus anophagefferens]